MEFTCEAIPGDFVHVASSPIVYARGASLAGRSMRAKRVLDVEHIVWLGPGGEDIFRRDDRRSLHPFIR